MQTLFDTVTQGFVGGTHALESALNLSEHLSFKVEMR